MTEIRSLARAQVPDDPVRFRDEIVAPGEPVLLRDVAANWPLLDGDEAAVLAAIRRYDAGRTAEAFVGRPDIGARYFYDDAGTGFNFTRQELPFAEALDRIVSTADEPDGDTMYMGSLTAETFLPGIERDVPLPFVPPRVRPRFWFGHASSVACHYDTMDNVACVALGHRRFTLYPPDAIGNLYVGPIDHTLAGQPVALAVGSAPGDARFPDSAAVRDRAIVVDLSPGDAIFMPKLWWHQVEATGRLNILVNYWWDAFGDGGDQPYNTMLLAMAAISSRPAAERAAWRAWFDHYVFRPDGHPLAFLPEERHGILAATSENMKRIRAIAMRLLRGA